MKTEWIHVEVDMPNAYDVVLVQVGTRQYQACLDTYGRWREAMARVYLENVRLWKRRD